MTFFQGQFVCADEKNTMKVLGNEDRENYPEIFAQRTKEFLKACSEHGQTKMYCKCIHEEGNGINAYHIFDTYAWMPDDKLKAKAEGAIWSVFPDIIRLRNKCGYPIKRNKAHNNAPKPTQKSRGLP